MLVNNIEEIATILGGEWINSPLKNWSPKIIVKRSSDKIRKVPQNSIVILDKSLGGENKLEILRPLKAKNACIIVDEDCAVNCLEGIPVFRTPLSAEEIRKEIAKHVRNKFSGKVIAITGSVGKTTTKNMLHDVLSQKYNSFVGEKSYNVVNMIVKQILSLVNEDYAIIEMDRYATLVGSKIAKPDVAIFTSLAEAHLGKHGSLEEMAKKKSRIFKGLNKGGVAVINNDIPHFDIVEKIAKKYAQKVITYGDKQGDVVLNKYDESSNSVEVNAFGEILNYSLGVDGYHNAVNSLAVIATFYALGINPGELVGYFQSVAPVEGRGSRCEIEVNNKKVALINDAYNANPLSMRASLATFSSQAHSGRKVLCLGDMLELGEESDKFHADLIDSVISTHADKVFLVGDYMTHLWEKLPEKMKGAHLMLSDELEPLLVKELSDNDLVLFKSSNATKLFDVCMSLDSKYGLGDKSGDV